jgi:signal transduction histidine kinase
VILFVIGSTLVDIAVYLTIVSDIEIFLSILSVSGVLITRILTFLVVGFLVSRMMAAQRQQRRALRQANQRLLGYTMALEQLTTSRERNRLARELHDTLAHTLSGLAVQLGAVKALWEKEEGQARLKLEEAIAATRSGLNETRRALQALRAEPLEDLGLIFALRELAQSAAARSGAELVLDLPEKALEIPANLSQAFYRSAQEALENIVRHARAGQIRISLKQEDQKLTLVVADDGIGFDPANSIHDTYGLRGLRERADLLDGVIRIESEPGQGTTITFTAEIRNGP